MVIMVILIMDGRKSSNIIANSNLPLLIKVFLWRVLVKVFLALFFFKGFSWSDQTLGLIIGKVYDIYLSIYSSGASTYFFH